MGPNQSQVGVQHLLYLFGSDPGLLRHQPGLNWQVNNHKPGLWARFDVEQICHIMGNDIVVGRG